MDGALTRCRATADHGPTALMAEHYAQRASAGLVISECTMVLPHTSSFATEPGIYSGDQIDGWRMVTEAVHQAGGRIFCRSGMAGAPAILCSMAVCSRWGPAPWPSPMPRCIPPGQGGL